MGDAPDGRGLRRHRRRRARRARRDGRRAAHPPLKACRQASSAASATATDPPTRRPSTTFGRRSASACRTSTCQMPTRARRMRRSQLHPGWTHLERARAARVAAIVRQVLLRARGGRVWARRLARHLPAYQCCPTCFMCDCGRLPIRPCKTNLYSCGAWMKMSAFWLASLRRRLTCRLCRPSSRTSTTRAARRPASRHHSVRRDAATRRARVGYGGPHEFI